MPYMVDHDLHIHSFLSTCSKCAEQTPERIAQYAVDANLKTICITDHFWDERVPGASSWYAPQDFSHISQSRPLPRIEGVRFLFGCETELDKDLTVGISPERMEEMDFVIIPTTHFHMKFALTDEEREGVKGRVSAWLRRLEGVLVKQLPFRKVGLAHLACHLIGRDREEYLQVMQALPEKPMEALFREAARLGVGIELNATDVKAAEGAEDVVLRPFHIAKSCGCRFYCGSDSHTPGGFIRAKQRFERAATVLGLTEEDTFRLPE